MSTASTLSAGRKRWQVAAAIVTVVLASGVGVIAQGGGNRWIFSGHDLHNTRSAKTENKINPANAVDLALKWVFTTGGDVTATPAVDSTNVYVPDWAGTLYSIDRRTGVENWSRQIGDYNGLPAGIGGGMSRTTPAIHGDSLIFGDQGGLAFAPVVGSVVSVNKHTGDLNWITEVGSHPATLVTQSPVVHANTVYVGVASYEETWAAFVPNYPCCSFRGSVVALDANTGAILWQTFMVPEGSGFSGNAVWGSTPVVDTKRGSVYVTTGNNYSAPQAVLDCLADLMLPSYENPNAAERVLIDGCMSLGMPDNHFDSVVAMDLQTGVIKWATKALPFDAWTISCLADAFPDLPINPEHCPSPAGPDYDFGQGPALFTVRGERGPPRDLLGAGQKSGHYWALDPDTGEVVWVNEGVPAGSSIVGGLQWGSATDGQRIYTANTIAGWNAIDPLTGTTLWGPIPPPGPPVRTFGAVTVANGVVFGGSMALEPDALTMFALSAETGDILFSFASGGSVGSGAAVVDGTVYWGSGYTSFNLGSPNNKLYAFEVPR